MNNVQKMILAVVVLTAFITTFTGSALNLAIPDISKEFGTAAAPAGWIITGYTLTVALCSLPAGFAADKTGRMRILICGLLVFGGTSVAAGLSMSAIFLVISRGLQGIGAAMIFSTNTAILAEAFPSEVRGKMLGYSLTATYIALSAGPFLGGIINHNLGWRWIFAVTGVITFVALILAIKIFKGKQYRIEQSGNDVMNNRISNIKDSLLDTPAYICGNIAALLNYGATFALTYLMSLYLQTVTGCSSQKAGLIMLAQPVLIAALSPVAGRISDSISPHRLAAAGMVLCAAAEAAGLLLAPAGGQPGLFANAISPLTNLFANTSAPLTNLFANITPNPTSPFANAAPEILIVIVILLIAGAGAALFSSPNTNAVMTSVWPQAYGLASSTLATMRAAGNTIGMLIITKIASFYIGNSGLKTADPHMITETMNICFIIFCAVCLTGVPLALIRKKQRVRE